MAVGELDALAELEARDVLSGKALQRARCHAIQREILRALARPLPDVAYYGDFAQIENGVGAVTALRERVRVGRAKLPRLTGRRIGVVTGVSMAPLMPDLLSQLTTATGAHFELIRVENSLFGPTTTTAGLLVGADMRRALADRYDLDMALVRGRPLPQHRLCRQLECRGGSRIQVYRRRIETQQGQCLCQQHCQGRWFAL